MNREEMNALLGATEDELDVIAQEYEEDTWDESHLGAVQQTTTQSEK